MKYLLLCFLKETMPSKQMNYTVFETLMFQCLKNLKETLLWMGHKNQMHSLFQAKMNLSLTIM